MKKLIIGLFVVLAIGTYNQSMVLANNPKSNIKVAKISKNELPFDIKYEGDIFDAYKWTDAEGEHIFISAITKVVEKQPNSDYSPWKEQFLYGYHFLIENNKSTLKWKVTDFIKECDFETSVNFSKSCEITDVDNDGIAEIWMMYTLFCGNDVAPTSMKIIMYEGSQKYAIRGKNKVVVGMDSNDKKIYLGGNYTLDTAFKNAPESIKNYAINMWKKHING